MGGGAAGTLTAVSLMRTAQLRPVHLTIVERSGRFGPGLAYSTTDPEHLLNSTVRQMSAHTDDPEHLLRWLLSCGSRADLHDYIPRARYGEYLEHVLESTRVPMASRLDLVTDEVVDIEERSGHVIVLLADGTVIATDAVVLALGNPPPRRRRPAVPTYVNDPWKPDALEDVTAANRVLLLGTGLTMVDVALTLDKRLPGVSLVATSRRGLLPRGHAGELVSPWSPNLPEVRTLQHVTKEVRRATQEVQRTGGDWRSVVDGMRPHLTGIWQGLSLEERQTFLRHLARHWEVHRHRMAPQVARRIGGLVGSGRLRILPVDAPRGNDFDVVVDCTGPQPVSLRGWSRLVDQLLHRGLARPDALALGLDTDEEAAIVGQSGAPSRRIFAIGYARRGTMWECTAVPEIRAHAEHLAAVLHRVATVDIEASAR